jgi:hypothetical protein
MAGEGSAWAGPNFRKGSTAVHPVSRGAALDDGIGRLSERFAGLARRPGYPHSETPGTVFSFIGIPHARYVP